MPLWSGAGVGNSCLDIERVPRNELIVPPHKNFNPFISFATNAAKIL